MTRRWREMDSNFRYRGRRPASGRSLRAQRVETDAAKGSSDQAVACLRRLGAGVVVSIMTSTVSSWQRGRPQVSIFRELRTRCGEKLAAVRRQEIELGSDGDDAGRVDRRVASIIVPLDMREIY